MALSTFFTRIPFGQTDSGKTAPFLIAISGGHYITISPHVKFSPLEVSDYLFSTTERPAGVFAANLAYIISQYEQRVHLLTEQISDARRRLSRHEVEIRILLNLWQLKIRSMNIEAVLEGDIPRYYTTNGKSPPSI